MGKPCAHGRSWLTAFLLDQGPEDPLLPPEAFQAMHTVPVNHDDPEDLEDPITNLAQSDSGRSHRLVPT